MKATTPTDAGRSDSEFRVLVMSGAPPRVLARLLTEICDSDAQRRVTGVLYWVPRPCPLHERVINFAKQLRKPGYLGYVARRLAGMAVAQCCRIGRFLWSLLHAGFGPQRPFGVAEMEEHCRLRGIEFLATDSFHAERSLAFAARNEPDLGIVYGTPILKPALFELPRLGSVNLHQRKVPDYRGGGPIGLWEMLDGADEIGITVHRVAKKVDAGAVVRSTTIPIEPLDTLASLEMKAHVLGIDLLVAAVNDLASDAATETAQTGSGRVFRTPKPEEMRGLLRRLRTRRGHQDAARTYPMWKLLARIALLAPWLIVRNWHRRLSGSFPVVVLYHHVITDRAHFMGMSTDRFMRQMSYLRRYYDVVDLHTALRRLSSGRVGKPTVVLTFDDGYGDNVLTLRAAALAGEVPAILYVCSQRIDSQQPFTHDMERGLEGFVPMTWDELRTMEAWGFFTGAHTRTHFDCGSTEEANLRREITGCRHEIEAQLGHGIADFSFPYGLPQNISKAAFEIATDDYGSVATAYGGVNRPGQSDPSHVFRCPHPSSLLELELLLQSILAFGQPDFWTGEVDRALPS